MIKQKPKKKKCRTCKKQFTPSRTTQTACSMNCAIIQGKTVQAKKERKQCREDKERTKDRRDHLKEAQAAFNTYIRLRDEKKPCISCGTTSNVQYAAGHYKTRGGHPELSFNLFNVHKQCNKNCNLEKSGNVLEYRKGLIERYGEWIVDYLEQHHESKKYTINDIKRIKSIFTKRLKILKKIRNNG